MMKMFFLKYKKIVFIIFTLLLSLSLYFVYKNQKEIDCATTIKSYYELIDCSKTWNKETLIFFDIDSTLIIPHDFELRDLHFPIDFRIRAVLSHPSLIFKKVREKLLSQIFIEAKYVVIEPIIIDIINELKNKGCTVMALTSTPSGQYGIIKNMEETRYNDFKKLGLIFSDLFPNTIFKSLKKYKGDYPTLYKGIIFSNEQSKGEVLGEFLDYFKINPKKIIFINEQLNNIRSVNEECKRRNIPHCSYQYIGSKKYPGTWNTKRALLQLEYLIEKGHWITDEQAECILKTAS